MILGSDVFERWGNDAAAQQERTRSSGLLATIGLGMIFVITLIQSGYVYRLPEDAVANFFTNILRNLQSGGPIGEPVLGAFATDHLTMIGRLTFIAAAFLTTLMTLDAHPANNPGEFYSLLIFSTLGMCLMSAASELILAYLAVELTSIPLYILAGYFGGNKKSSEAGMKYFLFGALSSGILLYGMSLTYGFAVSTLSESISEDVILTQFATIGGLVASGEQPIVVGDAPLLTLGLIFIVAGMGYKIAVVPFHSWSPDVYEGAPTPITAFISTASKMAGFLLLYRILVEVFPGIFIGTPVIQGEMVFGGWTGLLAAIALLTLLVGNLAALPQTNAKRLLAYSSIAHAGFLLMAMVAWALPQQVDGQAAPPSLLADLRSLGTSSLLYYLIVYTVTNLGAFGALAVVSRAVGGDDLRDLSGLAERNIGLAVLFTICVLSLAGIPPLSGFFAKFYVFMAAWQSGAQWLVIIGAITTLIGLYYYLRLVKAVFIEAPVSNEPVPTPPAMFATLTIATVLVVLLGVYPNVVLPVLDQVQLAAGGL